MVSLPDREMAGPPLGSGSDSNSRLPSASPATMEDATVSSTVSGRIVIVNGSESVSLEERLSSASTTR